MTNKLLIGIIVGVAIILLLAIVIIIIRLSKKNKSKVLPINKEILEKIYYSLGNNNVISVEKEQDRIKLIIKDAKHVDAKTLQELSIPAFLKGNELKLLYRNHSNELFNYIKESLAK